MSSNASFRPVPCIGGWQIVVTWPDARTEQLGFYSSEADASGRGNPAQLLRWVQPLATVAPGQFIAARDKRRRALSIDVRERAAGPGREAPAEKSADIGFRRIRDHPLFETARCLQRLRSQQPIAQVVDAGA